MKTIRIYDLIIDPLDPTTIEDMLLTEEDHGDDYDFDDEEQIEDLVVDYLHNNFDEDIISYEYEIIEE